VSEVFGKLGIDAEYNFTDYNGININEECGSMNPETLSKMLKDNQIGILFDGDADRCLFVLSQNRIINGDMLLSMNARKMLGENRLNKQTVVATVMSNLGFENSLKSNEIELKRTKVGDKYVLQNMIENEFSLGGEQSGHIIFFDKNTTGDGLITALETLNTLKKLEINLDEFYSEFPVYPQILKNIPVVDKKMVMQNEKIIDSLEEYGENKNIRIVLRPSGTEPLIRIMVEGRNENEVENVTNKLIELVEEILDE
jgi:phosphoglucosamine mutase